MNAILKSKHISKAYEMHSYQRGVKMNRQLAKAWKWSFAFWMDHPYKSANVHTFSEMILLLGKNPN